METRASLFSLRKFGTDAPLVGVGSFGWSGLLWFSATSTVIWMYCSSGFGEFHRLPPDAVSFFSSSFFRGTGCSELITHRLSFFPS
jgi:hypothetical protein